MTNSYSGDPSSSPKDTVRFLLSDTKTPWLFTDEEIAWALTEFGTTSGAAAELSLVMASKYTDKADKTVGPLSINYGEIAQRWRDLSASIRRRSAIGSGARAIMTQSSTDHIFAIGMNDNGSSTEQSLLGEE